MPTLQQRFSIQTPSLLEISDRVNLKTWVQVKLNSALGKLVHRLGLMERSEAFNAVSNKIKYHLIQINIKMSTKGGSAKLFY